MQRDVGKLNAFDFEALHELAREVQTSRRGGYGSLVLGKDALEVLQIFGFAFAADETGDGGFAEGI